MAVGKRPLQFTLRSMLLVMTVVCVLLGLYRWWFPSPRHIKDLPRIEVRKQIKQRADDKECRSIELTLLFSDGDVETYTDYEPFGTLDNFKVRTSAGTAYFINKVDHPWLGTVSGANPLTRRMNTSYQEALKFVRSKMDLDTMEYRDNRPREPEFGPLLTCRWYLIDEDFPRGFEPASKSQPKSD